MDSLQRGSKAKYRGARPRSPCPKLKLQNLTKYASIGWIRQEKKLKVSRPLMNSWELAFLHRARRGALLACMQAECCNNEPWPNFVTTAAPKIPENSY